MIIRIVANKKIPKITLRSAIKLDDIVDYHNL